MKSPLPRLAALTLLVASALAQAQQPAVIFDMGGKFDKSFNQAGYAGA
ncbi:BMP family ABC transporter substrate-binding protein, partial [Escherichia coli]